MVEENGGGLGIFGESVCFLHSRACVSLRLVLPFYLCLLDSSISNISFFLISFCLCMLTDNTFFFHIFYHHSSRCTDQPPRTCDIPKFNLTLYTRYYIRRSLSFTHPFHSLPRLSRSLISIMIERPSTLPVIPDVTTARPDMP